MYINSETDKPPMNDFLTIRPLKYRGQYNDCFAICDGKLVSNYEIVDR